MNNTCCLCIVFLLKSPPFSLSRFPGGYTGYAHPLDPTPIHFSSPPLSPVSTLFICFFCYPPSQNCRTQRTVEGCEQFEHDNDEMILLSLYLSPLPNTPPLFLSLSLSPTLSLARFIPSIYSLTFIQRPSSLAQKPSVLFVSFSFCSTHFRRPDSAISFYP